MTKLIWDGVEYSGNNFSFENGTLFVDGHAVCDYKEKVVRIVTDKITANINTTKDFIVRQGDLIECTIHANRVIINDGKLDNCTIIFKK